MIPIAIGTFSFGCAAGVLVVRLGTPSTHFLSFAAVLMVPKLLTFESLERARHVWLYSTSLKSNLYGGRWSWPVESADGSIDFIITSFFLIVTIRASVTPCCLSWSMSSSLVVFLSSGVLSTPFEVFNVLCGDTFTGTLANSVIFRSLVECD